MKLSEWMAAGKLLLPGMKVRQGTTIYVVVGVGREPLYSGSTVETLVVKVNHAGDGYVYTIREHQWSTVEVVMPEKVLQVSREGECWVTPEGLRLTPWALGVMKVNDWRVVEQKAGKARA